MFKPFATVLLLLVSPLSIAADKLEYMEFFDEYQRLFAEFDASVNQYYADDAKIVGVRKNSDGEEESMTIDGARWKTIVLASMESAEARGDTHDFTNISVDVVDGQAEITATRFSNANCFTDERFKLIVKPDAQSKFKIVEQFMETSPISKCDTPSPGLAVFLQNTSDLINNQLPAPIDPETQWIKTSVEGNRLTYHYVLANFTSETLAEEVARSKLEPAIKAQSCENPNMRSILDQNGELSFLYLGADAGQIVKFDIDRSVCTG